jgi:hypothetical protein
VIVDFLAVDIQRCKICATFNTLTSKCHRFWPVFVGRFWSSNVDNLQLIDFQGEDPFRKSWIASG